MKAQVKKKRLLTPFFSDPFFLQVVLPTADLTVIDYLIVTHGVAWGLNEFNKDASSTGKKKGPFFL